MDTYHKIQTVYLRDPATNHKTLLMGQFARPEFEALAGIDWQWTEKVDGTNVRLMWDGESLTLGGKTEAAQLHTGLTEYVFLNVTAENMSAVFRQTDGLSVCIYGEGYGEKIQSGGYYRHGQGIIVFDVLINGVWIEREQVEDIATALGLPIVPICGHGTLAEMVEYARSGYLSNVAEVSHRAAEGIVARPPVNLFNGRGERVITKIKLKDFRP